VSAEAARAEAVRRPDVAALVALALVGLVLRLAFRIDYDEDIDALRFRLGVERFDVVALRPHAPFYPVYVAAAKVVASAGASAHGALAIVGAICGAATLPCIALIAGLAGGRRAGYIAGALALASPFLWLTSEKLLSDAPGLLPLAAALALAQAARASPDPNRARSLRTVALLALGIGLGVRLSYFPFAAACLFAIARAEGSGPAWMARTRDLTTGVVVWLAPLIAVGGARDLVRVTHVQALGHFTRWGGTAITVPSPIDRLQGTVWGLWANALAGAWPDAPAARRFAAPFVLVLLAVGGYLLVARRRRHPELVLSAALYFVWAELAQNIAFKPRHWLPLAPLLLVAVALGADRAVARTRAAWPCVALVALLWFTDGLALVREHQRPSPAAALVAHLGARADATPVLTRDLGRMIAEGAPARSVTLVRTDAELLARLAEGDAFVTSEVLEPETMRALEAQGHRARVVFAAPRSRYVDPLWSDLSLVRIERPNPSSRY
jgi:hypothetical protein